MGKDVFQPQRKQKRMRVTNSENSKALGQSSI
jgi:hypothetical protein